ncbi:MAG: histidine phosphatase family protein [Bryobacteraceae bacterium]
MAPSTLILVRHAHSQYQDQDNESPPLPRLTGWHDEPLSPLGWNQLGCLQSCFSVRSNIKAIYASPLQRAEKTAQAAANQLDVRPRFLGSLREIYCGLLEGLPLREVHLRFPEMWNRNASQADETFRWPGGESYSQMRARVLRTMRRIAAVHRGERVLIVTHAGVISQLLGAMYDLSPARWGAFRPTNASITEVEWNGRNGVLLRFNDCSHLARLSQHVEPTSGAPTGIRTAHHTQPIPHC